MVKQTPLNKAEIKLRLEFRPIVIGEVNQGFMKVRGHESFYFFRLTAIANIRWNAFQKDSDR